MLAKGRLELAKLAGGTVTLGGALGPVLSVTHSAENERPTVARDGKVVDWDKLQAVWQPVTGPPVIAQDRFSGNLRVEAGGARFEGRLGEDGTYTFTNP